MQSNLIRLFLCIFFLQLCIDISAYDFQRDGIYYNILSEEEATCEVTSEYDYEYPESSYSGYVVIPETVFDSYWNGKEYKVIGIGDWAFYNSQLDGISLPSTIESIGKFSFENCTGISSLILPENIKYVGDDAFAYSNLGGSLIIPNSCKYVGASAFFETNISELTFERITYVNFDDLCSIGNIAFGNCDLLRTVNLNGLFYHIGINPFMRCDNLTEIEGWGGYTNSDISQGNLLIDGCLYSFTEKDDVCSLELICCPAGLSGFTSPNYYTGLEKKKHVLTSLGIQAFSGCEKITYLDIPNTVTKIGDYALFMPMGMDNDMTYRRVNIPESVEEVGETPFGWFGYNWDIYLYSTNVTDIHSISAPDDGSKYGTIHIPYGNLSSFGTDWTRQAFNIVDDIGLENVSLTMVGTIQTYCSNYDLDLTNVSNLKAYIVSGFSPSKNEALLTRVYKAQAGEGLILKGEIGDYQIPYVETDMLYSNLLKGVTTVTTISPTDGEYTNFILANGTHGIGFYPLLKTGEIAAGKAYLQLPTSSISTAARSIKMRFDDEESDIMDIQEKECSSIEACEYFDLQGRRINGINDRKGLIIVRSASRNKEEVKKMYIR